MSYAIIAMPCHINSLYASTASLARRYSDPVLILRKLKHDFPEELLPFLSGRRRHERIDSITETILRERQAFRQLLDEFPKQSNVMRKLSQRKFGFLSRRKINPDIEESKAVHLTSANGNWPVFKHVLPEIALAGHSNSGKSTLVNVLAGVHPNRGPAGVSDRAGWTDQICFYQLCKKPPVVVLADLPGYGHAITRDSTKKLWKQMTKDYLSRRIVLSRCCVLVDCSRGLCEEDVKLISFLTKSNVPWQVILTKADILDIADLSKSIAIIEIQLLQKFNIGSKMLWSTIPSSQSSTRVENEEIQKLNDSFASQMDYPLILPCSARTGAGITAVWYEMLKCVNSTAIKYDSETNDELQSYNNGLVDEDSEYEHPVDNDDMESYVDDGVNDCRVNENDTSIDKTVKRNIKSEYFGGENVRKDTRVREHIKANLLRKLSYVNTMTSQR